MRTRLYTLYVTAQGRILRVEEIGESVEAAISNARCRWGATRVEAVASPSGVTAGLVISRLETDD